MSTAPKPRVQYVTSSDIYPLLHTTKPPPSATTCPTYCNALGLDSDNEEEFRSEIDLDHLQEHWEATDTLKATKGAGIYNLTNNKNITNNYYPNARICFCNFSALRSQPDVTQTRITSMLVTSVTKALDKLGHFHYKRITTEVECCVDSVETEHMFPDYTSFLSYCPSK